MRPMSDEDLSYIQSRLNRRAAISPRAVERLLSEIRRLKAVDALRRSLREQERHDG